jgi:nitroimidazol reductase NimA-like FMN-containing flavoprotein (pyridoxamine 5'-phosphate oxidase superfamily)
MSNYFRAFNEIVWLVSILSVIKLPRMKDHEIDSLIQKQMICRIVFKGEEYPYVALFQYVCKNGSLYFHFTDYGKKMKLLETDQKVCVEIENYRKNLSEYRFVLLRGTLKVVKDARERADVIKKMAEQGRQKLSRNFLPAHGLKAEDGWASFNSTMPIIIVKLDEVSEKIGLKSP